MKKIFFILLFVFCIVVFTSKASDKNTPKKFKPTIESLQNYQCPEWFRDAKLGIYMHWG
ncbi:MAG: alpha-L-fucosidase, partial [Prolixibacteraceae bacterium]|nr:alpha-L-fucosidase [Prolixibacteraceae bacterium]